MKSAQIQNTEQVQHLKIVKTKKAAQKSVPIRLNINTLNPNFKYTNSNGEQISPSNFVLL